MVYYWFTRMGIPGFALTAGLLLTIFITIALVMSRGSGTGLFDKIEKRVPPKKDEPRPRQNYGTVQETQTP